MFNKLIVITSALRDSVQQRLATIRRWENLVDDFGYGFRVHVKCRLSRPCFALRFFQVEFRLPLRTNSAYETQLPESKPNCTIANDRSALIAYDTAIYRQLFGAIFPSTASKH